MREIKFRGKSFDKGWIYGNLIQSEQSAWIRESDYYNFKIDKNTIGQYTGLKDKNGTEIYEGDILKIRTVTIKQVVGYVEYSSNYCEYRVFTKNNGYVNLWKQLDIEVIGNVWDNPELLKAGD